MPHPEMYAAVNLILMGLPCEDEAALPESPAGYPGEHMRETL